MGIHGRKDRVLIQRPISRDKHPDVVSKILSGFLRRKDLVPFWVITMTFP